VCSQFLYAHSGGLVSHCKGGRHQTPVGRSTRKWKGLWSGVGPKPTGVNLLTHDAMSLSDMLQHASSLVLNLNCRFFLVSPRNLLCARVATFLHIYTLIPSLARGKHVCAYVCCVPNVWSATRDSGSHHLLSLAIVYKLHALPTICFFQAPAAEHAVQP